MERDNANDMDQVSQKEHMSISETARPGAELDPVKCKKLLWKIDLWLLPALWVIYLLSYVDRTNIGLAKVAGMEEDLQLTDNEYFMAIALFMTGYIIGEVPSNMLLSHCQPSIYISVLMFLWGAVAALLALVKTPAQLIGLRFLLGIFEAGFTPAVLYLISTWYKKDEQSWRFLIFMSAAIFSGAFGSLISAGITSGMDGAGGIAGWRWLFIVEGVLTCAVACVAPFFLLDYPLTTKKFTQEERELAYNRLLDDGVSSPTEDRLGHLQALWLAVKDWRVWLLSFAYMPVVSAFAFSYFFPTLVRGLGYEGRTIAQIMTAPLFLSALVVAIPTCWTADRMPTKRVFFIITCMLLCTVFNAVAAGVLDYIPRYVFLCFINSTIYTASPLALSYSSTCLAEVEPEKRAVGLALVNTMANVAQLYGSALFPSKDAPRYLTGFVVFAASMTFGAGLYFASFVLFRKYPFRRVASPAVST